MALKNQVNQLLQLHKLQHPVQAYVAFRTVKTLQGLHILNFNASAIKNSNDVQNETVRLNAKLLQNIPAIKRHENVTIALLNVRSVTAKLLDIASDNNLKSASVLCFCETWLSPSDPFPIVLDNQLSDVTGNRVIKVLL